MVPLCMEVKHHMAYKACKGQLMESLTVSYNPRNACVIMCITCGVLANGQRVLLGSELGKVVK